MNLDQTIRLVGITAAEQPVAYAVFDSPAPCYRTPSGGRVYPFGVGLILESLPRFLPAADLVEYQVSYRPGNEPTPIVVLDFTKSELETALCWKPRGGDLLSLRALLHEAKRWANVRGILEDDLERPDNDFRRARLVVGDEVRSKRDRLRWIMAWQLSRWEAAGFTQPKQFEHTQELATAYGLDPWRSFSTFQKTLNALKYP